MLHVRSLSGYFDCRPFKGFRRDADKKKLVDLCSQQSCRTFRNVCIVWDLTCIIINRAVAARAAAARAAEPQAVAAQAAAQALAQAMLLPAVLRMEPHLIQWSPVSK